MQTVMKRMGIKVEEVDAERVVIEGVEKNIVIENPQVMLTRMPNQEMFQVSGDVSEVDKTEEAAVDVRISDDDISMVADQAGVGKQQAKEMLEETRGDIAEAIMRLKESNLTKDEAD